MKDELNLAVAKELGWSKCACGDVNCGAAFPPNNGEVELGFPDFTTSLDACRDGWEKDLHDNGIKLEHYAAALCKVLAEDLDKMNKGSHMKRGTSYFYGRLACATPEQRCRAFLAWRSSANPPAGVV